MPEPGLGATKSVEAPQDLLRHLTEQLSFLFNIGKCRASVRKGKQKQKKKPPLGEDNRMGGKTPGWDLTRQ